MAKTPTRIRSGAPTAGLFSGVAFIEPFITFTCFNWNFFWPSQNLAQSELKQYSLSLTQTLTLTLTLNPTSTDL